VVGIPEVFEVWWGNNIGIAKYTFYFIGTPPHTPTTSGILPTPSLIPRKQTNSKTEFWKEKMNHWCGMCVIQDCGTLQEFAFTNVWNVCCVLYTIVTLFKIYPWQISLESVR
jgi:hypothetical protein